LGDKITLSLMTINGTIVDASKITWGIETVAGVDPSQYVSLVNNQLQINKLPTTNMSIGIRAIFVDDNKQQWYVEWATVLPTK
jgi:hypothetical protein